MCSKQHERFKSKRFQYDYRNKWIKNINKAYTTNVNVNLMVENVILIENLITTHAVVSVKMRKTIMRTKKIIFGVLLNSKYVESIYIDNSMITCDEIIETTKSTSTKTFLIVNSCWYLLLPDKISSKRKIFVTISCHN